MIPLMNWTYIKPITISNTGPEPTDYQVLVTVDTASLVTAGKLLPNCDDIRFTSDNGSTPLSYWIESGQNTPSTKIWVKIPLIITGSTTIYMYYGNPLALSESDGTNTFYFFDDFSRDMSKWTLMSGSLPIPTNGIITLVVSEIRANVTLTDLAVEYKRRFTSGGGPYGHPSGDISKMMYNGSEYYGILVANSDISQEYNIVKSGNSITSNTWTHNAEWHSSKFTKYGTNLTLYYNDNIMGSYTDSSPITSNLYITLAEARWAEGYGDVSYDDVRVRKYISPEPTSSVGAEQPIPPTIFNSFPSGATIIIDGTEIVQTTNTQLQLPLGIHNYILRLACHEDITGQIDVTLAHPTTVNGSFIKNTGDLSITSDPPGANVYIGIDLQGQTPLSYTCYPEGIYDYYISLLGYQPFIGRVSTIRNLLIEVNAPLIPVGPPGVGSIYIVSTPSGASIFLGDTDTGQITPDAIINIPIGPHTIRLEKTGYSPVTSPIITVEDNQTSSITMNLTIANTICSWIGSKGGWANIAVFDIMTLVSAYLGQTNIGFTVTISHIMGAVAYYLNNSSSGNSLTGCTF